MMQAKSFAPGEVAQEYDIGDFILCHRKGFVSACIRIGQRLRYRGAKRKYTFWSHAALVVSPHGDIIEALTKGVKRNHISEYANIEYTLVRVHASHEDQNQVITYANHVLGEEYGWLTILAAGLSMLPGWAITFGVKAHVICSGLVATALERVGYFFEDPANVMPADLAYTFGASTNLVSSESKPVHRK